MGRRPTYSRRCYLTLEAADADALDAYARERGLPAATVGARLLLEALRRAMSAEVDELTSARRQVASLEAEKDSLQRRLQAARRADEGASLPRWEWRVDDLLADRDWWKTWLPELYEVLGRQVQVFGQNTDAADSRSYVDLMTLLFPPIRDRTGGVVAEWDSTDYPTQAQEDCQHRSPVKATVNEATAACPAADTWEPVIRHVAKALSALEATSAAGADPSLRIRVEDDIAGAWLRTLRRLTGAEQAELPRAEMAVSGRPRY